MNHDYENTMIWNSNRNWMFLFRLPVIDSDDNPNSEAYVKLYFKTRLRIKKIVIYYDTTTLTAEIGSYVGMFLGVSLVDLAILFSSFCLSLFKNSTDKSDFIVAINWAWIK